VSNATTEVTAMKVWHLLAAATLTVPVLVAGPVPASALPACPAASPGAVIDGTAGDDTLTGTSGDDIIRAGDGDDVVDGGGGNDVIRGAGGKDSLDGGSGCDVLYGGDGVDFLWGGDGGDTGYGGGERNECYVEDAEVYSEIVSYWTYCSDAPL
jgi:Ca2+-binding RTX toxin-like protein